MPEQHAAAKPATQEKPRKESGGARKRPLVRWRELRSKIQEQVDVAEQVEGEIDQLLAEYRLGITDLAFKARLVDRKVWELRSITQTLMAETQKSTDDYPLVLHTNRFLAQLDAHWEQVLAKQKELRAAVREAPAKLQFYNRMYLHRQAKKTARDDLAERSTAISQGISQIEDILKDMEKSQSVDEMALVGGSTLLQSQEVLDNWKELLGKIYKLESSRTANSDLILSNVQQLRDLMLDSPYLARRLGDIELAFEDISVAKDRLESAGLMYEDQYAVAVVKLRELAPNLWMTGQLDQFEQVLVELQSFVNEARANMSKLRDEDIPAVIQTPTEFQTSVLATQSLASVIELARSFSNSLDDRDPYMKGHSERVANLAVTAAKAMNWKDFGYRISKPGCFAPRCRQDLHSRIDSAQALAAGQGDGSYPPTPPLWC